MLCDGKRPRNDKTSTRTGSIRMIKGLIRFLRVQDWFYFLALPVLSFELRVLSGWRLAMAILSAACCLAFAYGWNNLKDADARPGRSTAKHQPWFERKTPDIRALSTILIALLVCALVGSALIGTVALGASAIQLVTSTLYSGGPRLKRFPVIGTVSNVLIFSPLSFLGASHALPASREFWMFVALFSTLLLQNQLIHEVSDLDEDRGQSLRTTAIILGPKGAMTTSAVLGLLAGLLASGIGAWSRFPWITISFSLPIFVFAFYSLACLKKPLSDAKKLRIVQRFIGLLCGGAVWATFFLVPLFV